MTKKSKEIEINLSKCRWMLFTKNGKLITENHNQGITWKKVYKQEFNNLKALCFQLIPSGKKIFAAESPHDEYWTFEEMIVLAGQSIPKHTSRSICSLRDKKLQIWDVVTVHMNGDTERTVMSSKEIGYETRAFINIEDKELIRKGI